jgi:beta-mannosidase
MGVSRLLQDWSFTQVGGGEGTKDGEWLPVSEFPTTVHVELLRLQKIPDPVGVTVSNIAHANEKFQVHWTS